MSTIIHEIAHALGMQSHINSPSRLHGIMSDPKHHHIFGSSHEERQKWIGKNISDYAKSNKLETDAELAAKVISPGYVKGTLPKVLEDHVKWLFEGKD